MLAANVFVQGKIWKPSHSISLVLAILIAIGMVWAGWVGFEESDDLAYAIAAQAWIDHFPYLATDHWGLRHTIVLPMALVFSLFGESEVTLEVIPLLYAAALLLLMFYCLRRLDGTAAGILAVLLLAATPLFGSGASTVVTDLPEAFYVVASLWSFYFASMRSQRSLFVLSGALAGLGFITRETTAALLVFYGVLFLAGYGGGRARYILMGIGFMVVFGVDMGLLGWASGNPLYRFHTSMAGVRGDNPEMAVMFHTASGIDRFGSLRTPQWLQPISNLLANQNFGLVFWAAVPAALALTMARPASATRNVVRLFVGLAIVWFLVVSYAFAHFLWLVPRYQFVTLVCLLVPLAIGLAQLIVVRRAAIAVAIIVALLGGDMALVTVADHHLLFGERALVAFVRTHEGPVLTDPSTLRGAKWLLDTAGLGNRVTAATPTAGSVYFYYPRPRRSLPKDWPIRQPGPGWTSIAHYDEAPNPAAWIAHRIGVEHFLPAGIAGKLEREPRAAEAFRVSEATR